MTETTTVHVIRHGEVHNPAGVLYGRLPGFRLSARGERQALGVAQRLRARDITYIACSPMERAWQTAVPIGEPHRLKPVVDDRLVEARNDFEGQKVGVGDVAWRDPRAWAKLYNPFRPSWAEPFADIARRMLAAVQHACATAAGHEAVCVSHQLPIWILRRFLEGRWLAHDPRRRQCALISVTSVHFQGDELVGISYTDTSEIPRSLDNV